MSRRGPPNRCKSHPRDDETGSFALLSNWDFQWDVRIVWPPSSPSLVTPDITASQGLYHVRITPRGFQTSMRPSSTRTVVISCHCGRKQACVRQCHRFWGKIYEVAEMAFHHMIGSDLLACSRSCACAFRPLCTSHTHGLYPPTGRPAAARHDTHSTQRDAHSGAGEEVRGMHLLRN